MKNEQFKISVILPVYGGEQYLEQCLDSVICQTYKNLEIIVINDGSPDSCPSIIDRYASMDKRIIPIHKKNAGYGAAINSGLDVATGDFVAIVETDDWVQPDMFECLVNAYHKKPNPVVKASFNRLSNEVILNTQSLKHLCPFDSDNLAEITPESSIELFLLESSIWTALYKRDFLEVNAIRFYESPGAAYQDMPFKFITYAASEAITLVNTPVYNYRVMNAGSSSASSNNALISFKNYEIIKTYLQKQGLFNTYLYHFYFHLMFDLVFHSSRLTGEGLEAYQNAAIVAFEQGRYEGFDPDKRDIYFSADTNDYYHKHVLPIYNELMNKEVIKTLHTKNKIRKAIVTKLRYLMGKLIVEPIINTISAKIDSQASLQSSMLDKKLSDNLDSISLKFESDYASFVKDTSGKIDSLLLSPGCVKVKVAPSNQFYYYMRANEDRICKLRRDFKIGLDDFSLLNERKLFGFYECLPFFEHKGMELHIPLSLSLFTDEDRVILTNIETIVQKENESYHHLDTTELPITLATNYFKAGLKYLPDRLTEHFKGTIAIDCGAWVGDTAIMFASYGFKRVLALEPISDNYNCMLRNIERNKQYLGDVIEPMKVAAGNTTGNLSMIKIGEDGVGSCVVEGELTDIKVNSVTLDSLHIDGRVGLIKLDIEGYELMALKGAESLIRKDKPVLLISVYHLWLQPEQIFECKKFVEDLEMGYKFKFVHLQPERDLIYEYVLVCW